jgi:1-acyl-sn-glycerol-3-phosphate acyltransferase
MVGTIRLVLALLLVALATPPLAAWQAVAQRTGWMDDRRVPHAWHRMVVRLLGFRVRVTGEIATQRPLLIAANHISWTDIMVLGSLARLNFIAKSELAGWPIIGTFARMQRTVFVEREARRKSGEQAGEIAGRLADGDPMVLFAEGSTSDGNLIRPFKTTLFAAASMALEAGGDRAIAIQPVAIAYTRLHGMPMGRLHRRHAAWIGDRVLLPHIKELLSEGAIDLEVHFGEPVEFRAGSNRKEVAREVEHRVRDMMAAALRRPL